MGDRTEERFASLERAQRETNATLAEIRSGQQTLVEGQRLMVEGQRQVVDRLDRLVAATIGGRTDDAARFVDVEERLRRAEDRLDRTEYRLDRLEE